MVALQNWTTAIVRHSARLTLFADLNGPTQFPSGLSLQHTSRDGAEIKTLA